MRSRHPYTILALLFMATTINYLDRSVIGVLGPTLRDRVFHWSMEDYSWITVAFQLAYTIGLPLMGWAIDRIGVKAGFLLSIALWSLAGFSHALLRPEYGLIAFLCARFLLGLGESGNFPSCIKAIAEWFPIERRAFAAGIANAGSNVGAILAPLLIPLVVAADGARWQFGFLLSGALSAAWVLLWIGTYRSPDTGASLAPRIPWSQCLRRRETWIFATLKLTDAAWWFYLFWGGMFLADRFHLDIKHLGPPLVIIYLTADLGSIFGGWLSGALLSRGYPLIAARQLTLALCAACIFPVIFATRTGLEWVSVALIALAAGGHQAWSANVFTLVSDFFEKEAVASVVGIGGMVGSLASMLASLTLGKMVHSGNTSGYALPFLAAGSIYGITWLVARQALKRSAISVSAPASSCEPAPTQ